MKRVIGHYLSINGMIPYADKKTWLFFVKMDHSVRHAVTGLND